MNALEESIKHWERMRNFTDVNQFYDLECLGERDCALCNSYRDSRCEECPVKIKSGSRYCDDTPYGYAWFIYKELIKGNDLWDEWYNAAQAEIDFLKSLRD